MAVGRLISALDLDVDQLQLELEAMPLYDEFAERFDEAIKLIADGTELWRPCEKEDWAVEAVSEVRRKLFNIEQWAGRYPAQGLAAAVRHAGIWERRATDAQLAAAFGMALSSQSIETLRSWLCSLESPWFEASHSTFEDIKFDDPEGYAELIEEERSAKPMDEVEARERTADLIGRARLAMMVAALYQHPNIPPDVIEKISQQAVTRARETVAKKGGKESGESRRDNVADRNEVICSVGRALLAQGRGAREITSIVAGRAEAGGLTAKQIRTILRGGGVLPA